MGNKSSVTTICPCCGAKLTVDLATGDILLHEAPVKKPAVDLTNVKDKFKAEAQQREEIFQKSLDAEKRKSDTIKKRFDEAFRRAKENPDKPLPPREIDL